MSGTRGGNPGWEFAFQCAPSSAKGGRGVWSPPSPFCSAALTALVLCSPINTLCYDVGLWSWPRGVRERRVQWFTLHRSDGQTEMMWTQCYEKHIIFYCLFNMGSVYSVSSVIFSSQCLLCKTYDLFHLRKTPALGCGLGRKWWLMTWIKFTYQSCHSVSL